MSAARNKTKRPLIAAFDLLCCLLMVFVLSQGQHKPPHIQTFGQFAVTITWPAHSNDDVDLYVRDPLGNICYFGALTIGQMTLEGDDLGTATSGTTTLPDGRVVVSPYNGERTVLHAIVPGEYTVNVHMYNKADPGPTTVIVKLWSLRGNDQVVHTQTVVLTRQGQQVTAFRFTLDAAGHASNYNRLPAHLVQSLDIGGGVS